MTPNPTFSWRATGADGVYVLTVDGAEWPIVIAMLDVDKYAVRMAFSHEVATRLFHDLESAQNAAQSAWLDIANTPPQNRYVGPQAMRIEDLFRVRGLVKIKKLAELAGLSATSIASKVSRNTQLTVDESEAMTKVLREHGVVIERA